MVRLTNQDFFFEFHHGMTDQSGLFIWISPWYDRPIRMHTCACWPIRIFLCNFTMHMCACSNFTSVIVWISPWLLYGPIWFDQSESSMILLTNQHFYLNFTMLCNNGWYIREKIYWFVSKTRTVNLSHVSMTVDLSVCLFISLSDCWWVCLTVDESVCLFISQFVNC